MTKLKRRQKKNNPLTMTLVKPYFNHRKVIPHLPNFGILLVFGLRGLFPGPLATAMVCLLLQGAGQALGTHDPGEAFMQPPLPGFSKGRRNDPVSLFLLIFLCRLHQLFPLHPPVCGGAQQRRSRQRRVLQRAEDPWVVAGTISVLSRLKVEEGKKVGGIHL